jgi:hypothetical protein
MSISKFIRNSILQIAIFSIVTQAAFAGINDINVDLSSPSNKQLIQEYLPIDLTWDFLRQLEKTKCAGLDDTDNSIKLQGIEYTGKSADIKNDLPYTDKLSYPTLIKAIFNSDDQTFDLTYQYKYLLGKNHEFIIRAKPSIDKTHEFEIKLSNLLQQAPEKINDFILLDDKSESSADLSLLVENNTNNLSYFDEESYPVIIQNDSDYPVIIINGLSPLRCVAPHSTIVEHISDESNFRMYRINPASTILNVMGTATAVTAVGTIGSTLAIGACMLVSAPLSIPIITGAGILGGAGLTVYKWKKAAKTRYPVTRQALNPTETNCNLIAKIKIINDIDDASTINSTLKLVNAEKLMNKLSNHFFSELTKLSGDDSEVAEHFQERFVELTSNFNNAFEFNIKIAKLVLLVQELENVINPPEQKGVITQIIHWASNPENRDAVIKLVRAVK